MSGDSSANHTLSVATCPATTTARAAWATGWTTLASAVSATTTSSTTTCCKYRHSRNRPHTRPTGVGFIQHVLSRLAYSSRVRSRSKSGIVAWRDDLPAGTSQTLNVLNSGGSSQNCQKKQHDGPLPWRGPLLSSVNFIDRLVSPSF